MKKIFAVLVLTMICMTYIVAPARAAEEVMTQEPKEASAPAYLLPYPGLLSDSPFYKFKLLRDKIWLAITQDSIKKAQLYLLFADKKIAMAKILAEKKEFTLARDSALKGENELTELTFYYKAYNLKPDASFLSTLLRASQKHQQTLEEIKELVPEKEKAIYTTIVEFSKRNEDEFNILFKN